MDKKLRIFAGEVIVESKLSKPARIQLLNFIQNEASKSQVKALLMDGEIVNLDEQAEEIVNIRFEQHPVSKRVNEGGYRSIAGILLIWPSGWALYRAIRAAFDAKSKRCGVFAIGMERDVCLWKLRAEEQKQMIALVNKAKAKCSQQKNPAKCKAGAENLMKKHKAKHDKIIAKIRKFAGKSSKKALKSKRGEKRAADPATKMI